MFVEHDRLLQIKDMDREKTKGQIGEIHKVVGDLLQDKLSSMIEDHWKTFRSVVEAMESDMSEQGSHLQSKTVLLEAAHRDFEECRRKLNDTKKHKNELEERVSVLNQALETVTTQCQVVTNSRTILERDYQQLQEVKESLESSKAGIESKLEECSQALHAATQEREELRVQCESLLVTVTSLTQTISELEANSSRKEQSLLDLKEQYSCLATGFMEKEASFAHQITTLTTELCATEEKMAVAMRAVEEKNKRIEELQIEFVELEASLKSQISQNQLRHDEEVEQFKAMLEKLNQQACETSRVMEEKLLTESSNKALIAQLSFDLAAAKSDLKQAEATADELKIELAKVTGAMEKVLAERKTEVLALDTQIEALNETILSMERKLGHQGTIIAELNQRQEEVGRELSEKIQYADFLEAELKRHLVDADQEQEKSREVVVQFTTAQQELETSRDTCEELHELLKSALEREKNLQNKQRLLEQEFESERKRWQQELEYHDETVISQQSQQFSQKQKPIYAEECHLDVVATNWEDTGSQVDLIPETVVEPLLSGLAEKIETATTSAVSRKRSKQQRKVRIFDGKYWGMEVTAREGKGFLEEQGTLAYSPGSPRPRNFRFVDEKTGSPYKIHKSVLVSLKTYSPNSAHKRSATASLSQSESPLKRRKIDFTAK